MSTVATHGQCLAKISLGQPLPTTVHRKHTFGKKRIPLRRRVALHYVLRVQSQAGFGRGTVKIKDEETKVETESEPSSGTKKFFNLPGKTKIPGTVKLQSKGQSQSKSNKVIFVAGATGKVGSRTVRELLKLGFSVRAGTRNVEKAQALFEKVAQSGPVMKGSDDATPFGFFSRAKLFGFLRPKSEKLLEVVECDLEDAESIGPALGNAGVVVCCIGASEKEVLDVSGPYRIDFKATANLIDAASSAQVDHFVLLTSLGTQKFGFPAAVLNLFWGVLVWKAKAEKALQESGIPYTIVRPGGMERPTDAYKETHNLRLAEADKLFGGQVSNLQVAELLASIVENPDVSVNKIIEAVAETTAPLRPIRELLEEIPTLGETVSSPMSQKTRPPKADVSSQRASKKQEEEKLAEENRALALKEKEEKRIQTEKLAEEKLAKAQKEKEEKRIQAENDAKEKLRLQTLRKKYEEEIEAAREKEEAAKSAAAAALAEKAELEKRVAEVRAKAEAAALAASQAKAVEAAVVTAAQKGQVLSNAEKEKIMESVKFSMLPKEEPTPSPKKKPAFSFLGKAAAPPKETAKDDAEAEVKAKAEKEAAAKLAEQKQQEEKAKKEEAAKKLAEKEAAKALKAKQKEEQDRLEKEAKEQAEKEAAEAKRKEEAEAKRKEEEEAKEQAEKEAAEAKRKEEAEAKRKEEEAEARKKGEEAEAKRKEEEAQAKRKEEELAEAKKKEEQEKAEKEAERLKIEAEEKAKALAEQEKAEKEAERLKIEAEEKAKREAEEKAKALAEEEKVKAFAEQVVAADAAEAEKKALQKEEEPKEAPVPARRKGFRWFWQPAEPDTSEEEEVIKADVAEVPAQAKVIEQLPPSPTPLSPYTRYPGLKPPCPPIPSPPMSKAEKAESPKTKPVSSEINKVEQIKDEVGLLTKKEEEVIVEEPSIESQEDIEARAQKVQETIAREREALEKAQAAISLKWFWQKPEPVEKDSDSTSKEKESVPSSKEEAVSPVKEPVGAASKNDVLPHSSRPLSPYAQFPDLKPPAPPRASSPMPSGTMMELKTEETLPKSSTPLSPYPGFPDLKPPTSPTPLRSEVENGAMPENAAEEKEKTAEPTSTSGFKWPWQK